MNTTSRLLATGIGCLLAMMSVAQDLRGTLFQETDAAFERARAADIPLLAPQNFANADKYFQRADDNIKRGRSIEKIKEDLAESNRYLRAAEESSKLARVTFASTLQARDEAVAAQASRLAESEWSDAEDKFNRGASALEDGNVNRAKSYAGDALGIYKAAELTAIQGTILNRARELIAAANKDKVGKLAPKTLGRAEALVARAESDLVKDRYDTERPRAMARDAEYEAAHAAYIATVATQVKNKELTTEELILDWEQPLIAIAGQLDSPKDLSAGYTGVKDASLARIEKLQATNASQNEEISKLNLRVLDLEQSLGITTQRAQAGEARRQQVAALEKLFTPAEARIVREGENVIIRLIGLQFDSGEAVIQSRYFTLLRKISEAADVFPGATMIVEGHTDSVGSEQLNLALSERRANSVRDYLLASTVLGASQVQAVGYGKNRPIANNETAEGRGKNRRIDVVIVPDLR